MTRPTPTTFLASVLTLNKLGPTASAARRYLQGLAMVDLDLRNVDFSGADLSRCVLRRCCFDGADFTGAYLEEADISGCSFRHAVFSNALLALSVWNDNVVSPAQLFDADLHLARLPLVAVPANYERREDMTLRRRFDSLVAELHALGCIEGFAEEIYRARPTLHPKNLLELSTAIYADSPPSSAAR